MPLPLLVVDIDVDRVALGIDPDCPEGYCLGPRAVLVGGVVSDFWLGAEALEALLDRWSIEGVHFLHVDVGQAEVDLEEVVLAEGLVESLLQQLVSIILTRHHALVLDGYVIVLVSADRNLGVPAADEHGVAVLVEHAWLGQVRPVFIAAVVDGELHLMEEHALALQVEVGPVLGHQVGLEVCAAQVLEVVLALDTDGQVHVFNEVTERHVS
eukprot:CAMPEP_0170479684 /NCGR_PEP_ID=MMETSP0208-20121228/825_1 /TAXON_ID=197538 /ORGANISM="Strombidium inclinatum, Strain S3" /LENGTH=211 /DNA_ID=CAMNT_0010752125 /DNA_START=386 /DNA_END=1021 /DNA_ORIENTATION=-